MNHKEREDKSLLERPLPDAEEAVQHFWKEKNIFKKTLEKPSPSGNFVFYEGPPTANGRPGIHHLLSRAFKDVILRYKTMRGYHVPRRGGWDTHGLPVELEVEKKLSLTSKKDIESYGIAAFNAACKQSVWTYMDEWQKFTERIGYWIDQEKAYITYKPDYIESLWNIIGHIHERGLLEKDYKVVPWCPRCGTALSSHELAQGYATVKDLSVYVKFPLADDPSTSFIAWTTTPWTLPGHVALAVGEHIEYDVVVTEQGKIICAQERKEALGLHDKEVVKTLKGKDLVGTRYLPPYPYLGEHFHNDPILEKAFQVYPASFVTTEDGSGIVHTAVMYGQEDFDLGTKLGLPKHHLVGQDGVFYEGTGMFSGRFVRDENLAVDVVKDLASRELLFKKEKYEHSYPHCWRCKTALIYYARDSWYVRMSELRDELIHENTSIQWEPSHIREGRFGEWVKEVKDWAFSRERYWGTPLPVWMSPSGKKIVISSYEELSQKALSSGNTYYLMRHGEAEHNVADIVSSKKEHSHHLTERGREQVKESARALREKGITKIVASPFVRTRETAELVAQELGIDITSIMYDERIGEFDAGILDGKSFSRDYLLYEEQNIHSYDTKVEGGESYKDAKKRFGECIREYEKTSTQERILLVTHGIGFEVLEAAACGADDERSLTLLNESNPLLAEVRELKWLTLPRNEWHELDPHRPFIDEIRLSDETGEVYERVKDVVDVWFDSGAMPFAQDHYPFENKEYIETQGFPADYIAEGVDQTRGWFYTLHAVGVLMGRGKAYKNVVCLGHILDKEGKKMSKSLGNTINPWDEIARVGVDPVRFWMFSANQPGEAKNYDPALVDEVQRKVFAMVKNIIAFLDMYPEGEEEMKYRGTQGVSPHLLDLWILSRCAEVVEEVTISLDHYRPFEATRSLRDFVADFSQWYLRRSRDRFRNGGEDAHWARTTTVLVIKTLAKLFAPFTPHFAELLWQKIKMHHDEESVHLSDWPVLPSLGIQGEKKIDHLLADMRDVRKLVSLALEQRGRAGIKIRQPLSLLKINYGGPTLSQYYDIIRDEVNVKEVRHDGSLSEEVFLDTTLTPELIEEGNIREGIRMIQEARKHHGARPHELVRMVFTAEAAFHDVLSRARLQLEKETHTHLEIREGTLEVRVVE